MAEPDYRKLLEELAEWCDGEGDIAEGKYRRHENREYNEGYSDAMGAVARRIREVLK